MTGPGVPNYVPHLLTAFGGTLTGGEIWQCGVRGQPANDLTFSDRQDIADGIAARLPTYFSTGANQMSSAATLKYVKVNQIGQDGTYVGNPITVDTPDTPGPSSSGIPDILGCCFSWTTDMKRGLAHTGRIYPPVALTSRSNMVISQAEREQFVAAAKALFYVLLGDTSNPGMQPRVISSQGPWNFITGVRVGSIIDVQRRRKNALVEVYSTDTIL